MARYKGPLCKLCRREIQKLFLKGQRCYTEKCAVEREASFLTQKRKRQKISEYKLQLREKQKAKQIYGILERQFKRYVKLAQRMKGISEENLVKLLESRLDNIVFRLGFAASRIIARQLIQHGHILVNKKKVNIPSYLVKAGDKIEIKDRSKQLKIIQENIEIAKNKDIPFWLEVNKEKLEGQVVTIPSKEGMSFPFNLRLIIEFYSK